MGSVELRSTVAEARLQLALVGAGLLLLAAATVSGRGVVPATGLLVLLSLLVVGYWLAIRWDILVALILVVVLVIPIKRYEFAVNLPFDLEPYRIVTALLIALWSGAVLWLVFRGSAPWWSLAWGYAVAFGPQFVLCVMPFSPPVVVLLFFVAQVAFACAWVLIAMGVIGMGEAVWAALTLSLAVPVVTQTSRWLELTTIK